MRKLLLILSVLIFSLASCGQSYKEFTLQQIGLHIKIPNTYVIQNNFPEISFHDENGKQIRDSTKVRALKADLVKTLLVISSSERSNTASFNIALENAGTGNFELYYNFSKKMQQLMAEQQMSKCDTISSILRANNVNFHKFMVYSVNTNPIQYSGIYLVQVKEYFLVIKADYIDTTFGKEIEKAILASKLE